jgi:hypothetical protein
VDIPDDGGGGGGGSGGSDKISTRIYFLCLVQRQANQLSYGQFLLPRSSFVSYASRTTDSSVTYGLTDPHFEVCYTIH